MAIQKILILMSATGGGHKASAEALKAGFEERFPGRFQIEIVDLLIDHLPILLRELPKVYPFLANDAQWAWKLLWTTGDYPTQTRHLMQLVAQLSVRNVTRLFQEHNPDLLISVHPLTHEMAFAALRQLRWRRPFVTVVTDLASTHPLWFHKRATACYIASDVAYRHAISLGIRPDRLKLYGLPVRPAFVAPMQSKTELRKKLGMDPDLSAVLVIGGGDGIGPVAEIAEQVANRLSNGRQAVGQLVVVCGRNRVLVDQLTAHRWPIPTQINGFVNNMAEWMAACDCVVTKAGPGTIAEALICGLPIVVSGFIPGQEEENVPFVVENGAGAFSDEPAEIARIVHHWFTSDSEKLQQMSANARRLARPKATFQIVESIAELLGAKPELRVALLSDIHGNSLALDAVLEDIKQRGGVDEYWVLGDLAALGYDPVGVLQRLTRLPKVRFVRGNTDRYIVTGERPSPSINDVQNDPELAAVLVDVAGSFGWSQGAITASGWLHWLERLPVEFQAELPNGTRVLAVHASPGRDDGHGITANLSYDQLAALIADCDADLICTGHTHWPLERRVNGKHLVNLGSVSNPLAPDLRASYVLLQANSEGYEITHCRVDYSRGEVIAALERNRVPGRQFVIEHMLGQRKPQWER